jgi:hypothetical protein
MRYVVQAGDTLWAIAARYYGDPKSWRSIAADNNVTHAARLMIGDEVELRDALLKPAASPLTQLASASPDGDVQHRPSLVPGRAFVFVLADEVNPLSRKVVRKVMVSPRLAALYASRLGRPIPIVPNPELFGLRPTAPHSPVSMGRHALGIKPSPFMSASDHAMGVPRFSGRRFWIDVEKARASGATFHETHEIVQDLARIAGKTRKPADLAKVEMFKTLVAADREVLIRGAVSPAAIKGAGAMALTRGLQGVQVIGFVMTGVDLGVAATKSVRVGSVKPIAAESIRQAGSWAAAWGGIKLGAAAGALVGIETGPGAVLFAAGGAVVGGFSGYLGFDWVADQIDAN